MSDIAVQPRFDGSEIAIVGLAGRFPGASNVDAFWQNLRDGVESIVALSDEQLRAAGVSAALMARPEYVRAAAVLEGAEWFDAAFFGCSAREAELLDPQHRLFLECAWEAFEHAGYDPATFDGSVGVFAGAGRSAYFEHNLRSHAELMSTGGGYEAVLGNESDFLATRVAYKLNLRGPSLSIQTSCSTSLVAAHVACQHLLMQQCDMALAGGVYIGRLPATGYLWQPGAILSPDGHCRAFDARAQGTVAGRGVGIVVLKRLVDALRDGDTVHAVIRGSAVNNDGSTKVSYTAPSVAGQAEVIAEAMAVAGVQADSIGLVEAHGTGTALGDPAEVAALTKVYRTQTDRKAFCAIGSLKTNIGHLDVAAGVTGLIKATLALRHRLLPPSLHFATANPEIQFEDTPFYVNDRLRPWTSNGEPRRAAVSSFGIGGTNAHVVLEEAAEQPPIHTPALPHVVILSARTRPALDAATAQLADFMARHVILDLADAAFTLQVGRRAFEHRRIAVCRDTADAAAVLGFGSSARVFTAVARMPSPSCILMFSAFDGDARAPFGELCESEPAFRERFDRCAERAAAAFGIDLREPVDGNRHSPHVEALTLFATEYATAGVLETAGIVPSALSGFGVGELVAACVAGMISLEDALRLAAGAKGSVHASAPRMPVLSGRTGTLLTEADFENAHRWNELPDAPAVGNTLDSWLRDDARVLIDVGPGGSLARAVRQRVAGGVHTVIDLGGSESGGPTRASMLEGLGRAWLAGCDVDWIALHGAHRPRRVPLPTYPFERQRYFVEPQPSADLAAKPRRHEKLPNVSDWFRRPIWKQAPPLAVAETPAGGRSWLLLMDSRGVGDMLASALRARGDRVIEVRAGDQFQRIDDERFVMAPTRTDGYEQVLSAVTASGTPTFEIVHLWSIDESRTPVLETSISDSLDRGFYSLLALSQAFARKGSSRTWRVSVVGTGVHAVTGDEQLRPACAAILGPCRVIPQELHNLACVHVDVALSRGTLLGTGQVQLLIEELMAPVSQPVVAHRGVTRWVQAFEPMGVDPGGRPVRVRDRGCYLVTGGTGGMGLTLAEYLAERVQARLVLVGRTVWPPRSEWAVLMDASANDRVTRAIRRIQALERLGAEVVVETGDVASLDDMTRIVAAACERFGRIDGVIHAAGVAGGGLIPLKTRDVAASVLRPKVLGTFVLDEALRGKPLDFLVLCSSLQAFTGGVGQVDYCAANAVLDAYAHARWSAGDRAVVAIDWDAWREVGMAVETSVPDGMKDQRRQSLLNAILPAEGKLVFASALAAGLPEVAVYTQDFDAVAAAAAGRAPAASAAVEETPRASRHPRPAMSTRPTAPRTPLEQDVCDLFGDVLGFEQLGADDNFFDLGGHSLLIVDMVSRLKRRHGVDVPIARLYEGETLSPAFVAALLDEMSGKPESAPSAPSAARTTARHEFQMPTRSSDRPQAIQPSEEIKTMRHTRGIDHVDRSAIAIIGMSARFPGAPNLDAYWRNLRDGVDSRTEFTEEELRAAGIPLASIRHPKLVKSGFVLDDIDKFDASFFGMNPREAELLDPQHRLFLEGAWQALENAGYDGDTFDGAIAVFGGATMSGYLNANILRNAEVWRTVGMRQAIYGSVPDYMVTRVSYKLNLRGPCYFVQSACSTSLVAVHMGCQSLQNHESDMVLAGGVSVQVPHRVGYVYEEGGMMSPDGTCRTFDAAARGTVFGSGVGLVVLKRLEDAIADGDTIHAIIRGTAANNDGSLKVGFTAPSVVGQAQVISEAMANAGVSADSISYVEAHGTGTELGDPIEVAALSRAYRAHTDRRSYCALGSVKPNIGHLDAAAGVSSLIKTVLALEHNQLPPTIHFERPNPKIDFEDSPFFVNTTLTPWPSSGAPRRAGVSSFGFGGTNAHVVVEEAPQVEASSASKSEQLIVLSAKTETALEAAATALAEDLRRSPNANLADVAFTLQVGRRPFGYRRAIGCSTRQQAIEALEGADVRRVSNGQAPSKDRKVVFLFPGQGAQYIAMGAQLYAEEPVFRDIVDDCCEQLKAPLGLDLRDLLYSDEAVSDERSDRLKQTSNTQAALFVIEYALACLWMSWGIVPEACIGHSIGEFVAACLSGVLELSDALQLVALRGRLMEAMEAGVMAAVPLPENRVQPFLADGLWLAAVNGPSLCVVSGQHDRVAALVARLAADGIECRLLHTSHAFHSGMMEPAVAPFVAAVREIELGAPKIPYISNVTGDWATAAQVQQPEYWGRHIRQAVRFSDGVGQLLKQSDRLFLEIGPGSTLSSLVRQQTKGGGGHVIVSSLRGPQEHTSDAMTMSAALGRLWVMGAAVDWRGVHAGESRRRVPLPTYPFERQRYWVSPDKFNPVHAKRAIAGMEKPFSQWFQAPSWTRALPRPAGIAAKPETDGCLVFLDECGVGEAVATRLERDGHPVVRVRAAEVFAQSGEKTFSIDPASRSDYSKLLKALRASGSLPGMIAHCWGVTRRADPMPAQPAIRRYESLGFYSVMFLAQAFGELGVTAPLRLGVVTDGTQDVTGSETLVPEKASVFGPVRVIPKEFANISCRAIDLSLEPDALSESTITLLVGDLLATVNDREVAYRHGRRWTSCYASAHLPAAEDSPVRLKRGGVYLLTGGLGGISLVLARHLAESLQAKLVLTGRRGLPPKELWGDHVAQYGASDATSQRIRVVQELEAAGAEVLVGEADASDEERMRAVVDAAYARFGRIDGVVHAAGLPGAGMIQLKKAEAAAAVLAPKVDGARVLARIFSDRHDRHDPPLDFLLLCSSTTSVLGLVGQVDYCGANAYLDAFAHQYAAATGTFTVAINWSAWREVGMAVDTQSLRQNTSGDQMTESGLSNQDGIDAFRRILAHASDCQVAVTPFELKLLLEAERDEAAVSSEAPREAEASAASGTPASASTQTHHPRPNLQSVYVAARSDVEKKICRVWQEMLGIEPVGVHDNFFDLGGHSLLAVLVMTRVNDVLRTEIPVAKLYEGLTVSFLAGLAAPGTEPALDEDGDADMAERRREKAKRQREHQQRRRVALGR